MKILLMSTGDVQGGAGRCAYRLMRGLRVYGADAKLLTLSSKAHDPDSMEIDNLWIKFGNKLNLLEKPDKLISKLNRYKGKSLFSAAVSGVSGVVEKYKAFNPDIVHLHWFQGGFIRPETLKRFNCPVIITMHDMWTFTGGCHYDDECGKYVSGCGNCPMFNSDKENDLSRRVFKRKQKAYQAVESLLIAGTSSWLTNCARQSKMLEGVRIEQLPTGLDTTEFKPIEKSVARDIFNLPQDKKLVIFGAMNATSDTRKGYNYLRDALNLIPEIREKKDVEVIIFGGSKFSSDESMRIPQHPTGHLFDNVSLKTLYSAADVMVVPSVQENLANTILESLACKTPVVGFDIGGNKDMIHHQSNGYLAKPFDVKDLARGINWVIDDEARRKELAAYGRDLMEQKFDIGLLSEKHIKLYKELIAK